MEVLSVERSPNGDLIVRAEALEDLVAGCWAAVRELCMRDGVPAEIKREGFLLNHQLYKFSNKLEFDP